MNDVRTFPAKQPKEPPRSPSKVGETDLLVFMYSEKFPDRKSSCAQLFRVMTARLEAADGGRELVFRQALDGEPGELLGSAEIHRSNQVQDLYWPHSRPLARYALDVSSKPLRNPK